MIHSELESSEAGKRIGIWYVIARCPLPVYSCFTLDLSLRIEHKRPLHSLFFIPSVDFSCQVTKCAFGVHRSRDTLASPPPPAPQGLDDDEEYPDDLSGDGNTAPGEWTGTSPAGASSVMGQDVSSSQGPPADGEGDSSPEDDDLLGM